MSAETAPDALLVSSAAHVFVESLDAPALGVDDSHHLSRVLRLRDGEPVSVTDGHGLWRMCRFTPSPPSLVVAGELKESVAAQAAAGVAVSVPKGDRIEWTVQKLTEVGIDRIVLMHTDRSVVVWDANQAERHLRRLEAIARAAAMQARRLTLPRLDHMVCFDDLVDTEGLVIAGFGGHSRLATMTASLVAVGPEGGWSPREAALADTRNVPTASLGATVLRTETAAIVAGVLLTEKARR